MMDRPSQKSRPASADEQRLSQTRDALLTLHKALVEFERVRYEKVVGSIPSPNHFLRLLTTDPWFAWLHPISQLIVSMDEALDGKEPLTGAQVTAFIEQTSRLLVASESGHDFPRQYFEALQDDPDVVLAHAAVRKAIAGKK